MPRQLHPDFEFSIAPHSDVSEVFGVMERAFENDELWRPMTKNVKPEDVHDWIMTELGPRWTFPDIEVYKISEKATGKIVAWTALQYPWKEKPLTDEMKAMVLDQHMPPLIEGMDLEAAGETMAMLSIAFKHGYDPDVDYHRKGTMVHPDFQKKGFGTVLTQHCNDIADKAGARTFLPARPNSHPMFLNMGFKDVGTIDSHVERWGENPERGITWAMLREPATA